MKIPIQNIYYLLCYAWNKLDQKDKVSVSIDGNTTLLDLFAKVLINATRILLKRGFDRDYVLHTEERVGIKGKIEVSTTIKKNSLRKYKAFCSFDEYSADILNNQILYTTLHKLLYISTLDVELKDQIRKLLRMFPAISLLNLKSAHFKGTRIHRNNRFYEFILNVCQIIFDNSLPDEQTGNWMFNDFTRDEKKMAYLFEEFVFQFYKNERSDLNPNRKHINWQFGSQTFSDTAYLPVMKTDITLESDEHRIIIDTKYYQETMSSRYNQDKIKSENLYQLFSYLINQEDGEEKYYKTKGILLYPTIDEEFDLSYQYQSHQIEIKTLNLNANWSVIEQRLHNLIK